MKKLEEGFRRIFLVLFISLIFASCRQVKGSENQFDSQDPELILTFMSIHKDEVEKGKISIKAEIDKIESGDIIARFRYGQTAEKPIPVTIMNSPFTIAENETKTLHLKVDAVPGKYRKWEDKIDVTRKKAKALTAILVFGGRDHGTEQKEILKGEALTPILNGEEKTLEILGPIARVCFASEKIKWTSIKIDNKPVAHEEMSGFKSVAIHIAMLTKPVVLNFEIVAEGQTLKGKLNLSRKAEMSDISELELYINDQKIIKKKDEEPKGHLLEVLWKGKYEISVGQDSANIQVASIFPFIKNIKIDGNVVVPAKGKISTMPRLNVADYRIEGITEEGKDVTVEISPTMSTIFHPVIWKFKVKK